MASDPQRCKRLHYVALEAQPLRADELLRGVMADAALAPLLPLAQELTRRYPLALPGLHRLEFAEGDDRLVLTLAIGDVATLLRDLHLAADAVYLNSSTTATPPALMKSIARLMRPQGTLAGDAANSTNADLRDSLTQAGFSVDPDSATLRATYAPRWARPSGWPDNTPPAPRDATPHALVIGAGLAGAARPPRVENHGFAHSNAFSLFGPRRHAARHRARAGPAC